VGKPDRHGIPTMHAGYQMRSYLEARWSSFCTALGWSWVYEPFELEGWIPDLLIRNPTRKPVLIDVKPCTSSRPDRETVDKLGRAMRPHIGEYRAVITRLAPQEGPHGCTSIGWEVRSGENGWYADEVALIKPLRAGYGITSIGEYLQDWMSPCNGPDVWGGAPHEEIEAIWRGACNAVQWKPRQRR
jgi:hypothetical protein